MSERYAISMDIGGVFKFNKLKGLYTDKNPIEELLCEINGQSAGPTWGESFGSDKDIIKYLKKCSDTKKPLELYDDQSSGNMDGLRAFCQEYNLSYRSSCEGGYDNDPQIIVWEPGMDKPKEIYTDSGGESTLTVDIIRREILDTKLTPAKKVKKLQRICDKLTDTLELPPFELGDLPPFEV